MNDDLYFLLSLLLPEIFLQRIDIVENQSSKFVHYTTASNALKLLSSKEFWMRKSSVMNDFQEIDHGLNC